MRLSFTSPGSRRARRDRGAVLIEAAIAIPLLLLVILGAFEAGMAWDAKSGTTNGLRSGLLRAASIGDKPETDLRILQSIVGEVGPDNVSQLDWVVVFDASANSGDHALTVNQCVAAIAGGGLDGAGGNARCVVYNPTTLTAVAESTLTPASFDNGGNGDAAGYTCDTASNILDANFCAPSRSVNGDIQIGVALQYKHDWTTGILPFDPPLMREIGVSSTFVQDGIEIVGTHNYVPQNQTVYDSGSFDGPLNSPNVNWTGLDDSAISETPAGDNFLGPFDKNDVESVTLLNLPPHSEVCITFDFYAIGSWDGLRPDHGDDAFMVDIDTSDGVEEFKDRFDWTKDTSQNGLVATGQDLGYEGTSSGEYLSNPNWGDNVYEITVCAPHSGDSVEIDFSTTLSSALNDEGWGIGNMVVSTNP